MSFRPYIPAETRLREFSPLPLIVGVLLGMVFGASSLYLVLKVGLTVSASIPVAVISITLFKMLSRFGVREATILEHNIVQTAGSAGESIAFGVGVTMPAIMILGFDLEVTRVALVAVLGGLLGILMMIPLRRPLIVHQHGILKYPEGTACAAVLKAGASRESREAADSQQDRGSAGGISAGTIFGGFGVGLVYKTAMEAFKAWKSVPEKVFGEPMRAASVAAEISPELLGVGYIIGPGIASVMCAGGVLAYLVLIPLIKFFGDAIPGALAPGTVPISEMGPNDIRGAYILYIGAGAVAAGGIISLFRSLPLIWHGIKEGIRDARGGLGSSQNAPRTDQDLPMAFVIGGIAVLVLAILLARPLHMNLVGALLIVIFGFLFVTVSSRLCGEIGSSSNPISGMTVATLLLTSLGFLALGWTQPAYYVTALSVGAVVCIAASNGGTTSQDLKTGFLVGATPRLQQVAILLGALASALVLGPILLRLNDSGTVFVPRAQLLQAGMPAELRADPAEIEANTEGLRGPQALHDTAQYRVWHKIEASAGAPPGRYLVDDGGQPVYLEDPGINGVHNTRPDGSRVQKFDAPKATLMSYIIKGILDRELPWGLVLIGVMISVVLEMAGIPSLAFAVGVYLPISSSTPILVGGMVRWLVDRRDRVLHAGKTEEEIVAEGDRSPGVLMASGYIAGGAIAGIVIAFMASQAASLAERIEGVMQAGNPFYAGPWSDTLALLPFAGLVVLLYVTAVYAKPEETARQPATPDADV